MWNWIGSKIVWSDSWIVLHVIWFEIQRTGGSSDLKLNCFETPSIWGSSVFVVSSSFNWFEVQVVRDSSALVVNWLGRQAFGCQLNRISSDLIANHWFGIQVFEWFEIQVATWDSSYVKFRWYFRFGRFEIQLVRECFEITLTGKSFSLRSNGFEIQEMKLWSSTTKLFCETSFKNEAFKLTNQTFSRHFLQESSFEAQKRSCSAILPSKMKLWSSKTKRFLQKRYVDQKLHFRIPIFQRLLNGCFTSTAPATKRKLK